MSFKEEFCKIDSILKEKCGIELKEEYDALIVKKMSATNCIGKTIKSHQSHIAITGSQMNMFPYIYQKEYIEENNKGMKNFFVFKAPVYIFKKNCYYLDENSCIDFKEQERKKEGMCIYPRSDGDQVQLSMKKNDTPDFISFRELIKEGDYLIVLKHKEKLKYDMFAIKDADGKNTLGEKSIFECASNCNTFITEESLVYKKYIDRPHQRIFFGAPGTGKSYYLNCEAKEYFNENYERVTFHPNYMYGNFVGAFKPFPYFLKDKDGEILTDEHGNKLEKITYKYVEGPLMRSLLKALKNPSENYLLIIEEINRANTAAVFGDFFQLLDRNDTGESEYAISTSEDMRIYLEESLSNKDVSKETREYIKHKIGENYERIILPKNLYIWATMNSADQGVMPMDTAFKRRWEFRYIGINEVLEDPKIAREFELYKFKIAENKVAKWNDFRVEVNKRLSSCKIPEDKLLGPYFISKAVLESGDIQKITNVIKNKVLMYLYDDAGKPYRNKLFVSEKATTYSTLCNSFSEDGNLIFKENMNIGVSTTEEHDYSKIEELDEIYKITEENHIMDNVAENKESRQI